MPLPSSPNPISLSQIATEFEDTAPHSLSEFYGLGTPSLPSSGEISFSDFRGISSHLENVWTVQQSHQVGHTRVQNATGFNVSGSTTNWAAGDLLVLVTKINAVSSSAKSGWFVTPSGWTEGRITQDIYNKPNLHIFARIITSTMVSGGTWGQSFTLDPTESQYMSTIDHSWGYGWWRLRKTANVSGHDSIERKASTSSITTTSSSISRSIPNFTPFDNADSPILVGITSHLSSTSGWSGLTNYSGMNSNTLGHSNSSLEEQNWAAAIQTWSNRSQPSNITGYATGHTVAWCMFVTPPE